MHTKEKLANALAAADCAALAVLARNGYYDDFESDLAAPKQALVQALNDMDSEAAHELAKRVIAGAFDNTRQEAEAWFKKEGLLGP